ncbi:ComEA family DNA-binding protein [Paenibacillus sonchi]|uniref:ComEA family DNA-binding protein n=1 Tax=Paenibacillus sonchi TaxID=373687 RepID=UPI001E2E4562|nr:helix-hairpin-helix domain-containing protein [Paenibacillus sonchi]MCE3202666.1 helix-hairpin-helix domain-containing protein [Paenibacillus sonchi]
MNVKKITSMMAAALLGGGLIWAAGREEDNGIAGWESMNVSMAQALGVADKPNTTVAAGAEGGEARNTKEATVDKEADVDKEAAVDKGAAVGGGETGSGLKGTPDTAEAGSAGDMVNGSIAGAAGGGGAAATAAGNASPPIAEARDAAGTVSSSAVSTSAASTSTASNSTTSTGQASTDGRINVNTADAAALMDLPGIGGKKAQAIIDYRSSKGAFHSLTDLGEVKGIGPKMLEKLEPLVSF